MLATLVVLLVLLIGLFGVNYSKAHDYWMMQCGAVCDDYERRLKALVRVYDLRAKCCMAAIVIITAAAIIAGLGND